jgi:uncharacterized protein YwqG
MPVNKASVRRELKRFKLSDYQDLVLDSLEPAVRIFTGKPVKKLLPVGASKFGGEPDLPSAESWPIHPSGRPMHFLGQISLSDLPAAHLRSTKLPQKGWLRFWWDKLGYWLTSNTRLRDDFIGEDFRVTFDDCRIAQLNRCSFPTFPEPKIPKVKKLWHYEPPTFKPDPEAPLHFKPVNSIHHKVLLKLFAKAELQNPKMGRNRVYEFYEAIHLEKRRQPKHRLLGDVDEAQSDMRGDCHAIAKDRGKLRSTLPQGLRTYVPPTEQQRKPWRLLALLDSDFEGLGWMWSDAGELCFWIREKDMEKRDFSKAIGVIESS